MILKLCCKSRAFLSYTFLSPNKIYREGCGMTSHKRFTKFRSSAVSRTILSAGWGMLIILLIILAFSFVMTKIDVSDQVLSVITAAALCIGAYFGGYISAKNHRKNGLVMGIACGCVIFLILVILSAFFPKSAQGLSGGAKLFMVLMCGSVGGIVGVNSKHTRYK